MFELSALSIFEYCVLIFTSLVGSMISAAAGVGGGTLLLIVMTNFIPAVALIPVHGMVQLGSNGSRAFLTRKYVKIKSVLFFLLGALIAALISSMFISDLDLSWLPMSISIFVLWLCWGKLPSFGFGLSKISMLIGGCITTIASMLVGASGPLVSAWIGNQSDNRWHYTATFSFCMSIQHSLKLVVFGVLGFAFWEWLVLISLMILSGYIGTRIGLKLLGKLPEESFKWAFKIGLSILAIRTIWINV